MQWMGVSIGEWAQTVIALTALGYAIYEGWLSRRHDRLMVVPELLVRHVNNQDGAFIYIRNVGLGPARLVAIRVFENGVPIRTKTVAAEDPTAFASVAIADSLVQRIAAHTAEAQSRGERGSLVKHYGVHGRRTLIPAGDEVNVFGLSGTACQDEVLCQALFDFTLEVDYESIYGQSFHSPEQGR